MNDLSFWVDEQGQDMVEYVLILGAVSLAGAAAVIGMGGSINILWSVVNTRLTSASN